MTAPNTRTNTEVDLYTLDIEGFINNVRKEISRYSARQTAIYFETGSLCGETGIDSPQLLEVKRMLVRERLRREPESFREAFRTCLEHDCGVIYED